MAALPAPSTRATCHAQGGGALANAARRPLSQAFPLSTSLHLRHGSPRFNPACLYSANTLPSLLFVDLVPGCLPQGSPRALPPHRRDLYGQLKFQGRYSRASVHSLCWLQEVKRQHSPRPPQLCPGTDGSLRPLLPPALLVQRCPLVASAPHTSAELSTAVCVQN